MNIIYRCKIKTHPAFRNPDSVKYITLFYDESIDEVINYMADYDKKTVLPILTNTVIAIHLLI